MHARAEDIVQRALEYVETPYRHQGRSIVSGIDCAGLIICVAHDVGISTFDTVDYTRRPSPRRFRMYMLKAGCTPLNLNDVESGDIVRMAESPGLPVHIGIFQRDNYGREYIIHAYTDNGRTGKVRHEAVTPARWSKVTEAMRFPD